MSRKEGRWTPFMTQINENWIKYLNVGAEPLQLLEGHTGAKIHDVAFVSDLLAITLKAQQLEITDDLDFHKMKTLGHQRTHQGHEKTTHGTGENIFIYPVRDQHPEYIQTPTAWQQQNDPVKKWAKTRNSHVFREDTRLAKWHVTLDVPPRQGNHRTVTRHHGCEECCRQNPEHARPWKLCIHHRHSRKPREDSGRKYRVTPWFQSRALPPRTLEQGVYEARVLCVQSGCELAVTPLRTPQHPPALGDTRATCAWAWGWG